MSKKIFTALDFNKNEIQNAVVQVLAGNPVTPQVGQIWYNTALNRMVYEGGAGVIDPTARVNHSGTQLAATISDLSAAVQLSRLDQFAAPIGAVSMGGQRLSGLADASSAQDAVTYLQLQNVLNGRDFKQAVRVATTTPVAQNGLAAIDTIVLVDGDRILDKDATDASLRGIWIAHAGAWTRAADFDTSAKVETGLTTMVEDGAVNQLRQYTLSTKAPIVLGTTALTFVKTGDGTPMVQGAGILIAGNVVSIDTGVVARKFAAFVGDGTATSFAVSHGLATLDVSVSVFEVASGSTVECDVTRTSTGVVTLSFVGIVPTANGFRVVIQG